MSLKLINFTTEHLHSRMNFGKNVIVLNLSIFDFNFVFHLLIFAFIHFKDGKNRSAAYFYVMKEKMYSNK